MLNLWPYEHVHGFLCGLRGKTEYALNTLSKLLIFISVRCFYTTFGRFFPHFGINGSFAQDVVLCHSHDLDMVSSSRCRSVGVAH